VLLVSFQLSLRTLTLASDRMVMTSWGLPVLVPFRNGMRLTPSMSVGAVVPPASRQVGRMSMACMGP